MSSPKQFHAVFHDRRMPAVDAARYIAAWCLAGASTALAALAARLLPPVIHPRRAAPHLEFDADTGEETGGVLFVDGVRVGCIRGVMRL